MLVTRLASPVGWKQHRPPLWSSNQLLAGHVGIHLQNKGNTLFTKKLVSDTGAWILANQTSPIVDFWQYSQWGKVCSQWFSISKHWLSIGVILHVWSSRSSSSALLILRGTNICSFLTCTCKGNLNYSHVSIFFFLIEAVKIWHVISIKWTSR